MHVQKFRAIPALLFSVVALLIFVTLSPAAQTLVTPSVSVFHFTDGGDDFPGRMTADAAGNFYVAAQLEDTTQRSGFGVLKYRFNGPLQGVFGYKLSSGEFGGLARDVRWTDWAISTPLEIRTSEDLS